MLFVFIILLFNKHTFFNFPQLIAVEEKVKYVLSTSENADNDQLSSESLLDRDIINTPTVTIKNPIDGSTIPANDIVVNGTAFDKDDDIGVKRYLLIVTPLMAFMIINLLTPHLNIQFGKPRENKDGDDRKDVENGGDDAEESWSAGGRQNWSQWSIPIHFDKNGP